MILLATSALAFIGCASLPISFSDSPATPASNEAVVTAGAERFVPAGPGTVFESVEAAAADAMVYAYLASRGSQESRSAVRGGSIFPKAEGYSYGEPVRSIDGPGNRLQYRLRPDDVAHYRQFPAHAGSTLISTGGTLVVSDRHVVNTQDPLSRPLFYLTPRRQMKVYLGAEEGEQVLGRIVFGVMRGDTSVELTGLGQSATPLVAAQDGMEGSN